MRVLLIFCALTGTIFAQQDSREARDALRNQLRVAEKVADVWLKLLDAEKFDQAWDQTTVFFKSKIDRKAWDGLAVAISQQHRDFGGGGFRHQIRSQVALTPPPGFPEGAWCAFYYQTRYPDGSRVYETVIAQTDENGHF